MNIKKKYIYNKIYKYFKKYKYLYIINISRFNSNLLYKFKKDCYSNNIILINIKNNLLKLIFKKLKIKKLNKILIYSTSLMFSNNINISAKIINNHKIHIYDKIYPIFKAAYLDNTIYIGEKYLKFLYNIKSKEEILLNILLNIKNTFNNFITNYINNYNNILFNIIKGLKKK
ncbi:MAG: 50S ribosomal protein L10 [Candidatus Shikimatogenerans sp. JK-2022]|nr:50S ribosomal protein L10 [Candidatus Shikimatogenerans bostrichidophilus]